MVDDFLGLSSLAHPGRGGIDWEAWASSWCPAFTAALVYLPPLQQLFGTAAVGPGTLAVIAPFPLIVWGIDELRRLRRRRRHDRLGSSGRPAAYDKTG